MWTNSTIFRQRVPLGPGRNYAVK